MNERFNTAVVAGMFGVAAAVPAIVLMEVMANADGGAAGEWLFHLVPPVSVGIGLWLASRRAGLTGVRAGAWGLAVMAAAAIVSWYVAREVYVAVGGALADAAAGAVGGLLLALPLPWVWTGVTGSRRLVVFAVAVLAGAMGAWLAVAVRAVFGEALDAGDRWLHVLMVVWQATVFASLVTSGLLLRRR